MPINGDEVEWRCHCISCLRDTRLCAFGAVEFVDVTILRIPETDLRIRRSGAKSDRLRLQVVPTNAVVSRP